MTFVASFVLAAGFMFVVYRLLGGKIERHYPFLPSPMDGAGYARMAVGAVIAVLALNVIAPLLSGFLPN
jgi:hypothetical protein